jgi:hypothetical protein
MKKTISCLVTIFLMCCVAACVMESAPESEQSEVQAISTDDGPSVAGEVVTQASGCSVVQWCNAPGPDGAVCKQLGCDFHSAFTECVDETPRVCGTPRCPWRFKQLDGQSFDICEF